MLNSVPSSAAASLLTVMQVTCAFYVLRAKHLGLHDVWPNITIASFHVPAFLEEPVFMKA